MRPELDSGWKALRRTAVPYVGTVVILAAVSLFGAFVAIEHRQWQIFGALALLWLLYLPTVYIGTRYRILWGEDRIRQIASGGPDIIILMNEIDLVRLEVDVAAGRPFRRIAIYKGSATSSGSFIDVSLKHFLAEDIRTLMQAIHRQCPRLEMPTHWLQT